MSTDPHLDEPRRGETRRDETSPAQAPPPLNADPERSDTALHDAVHGLRESDPLASASVAFVPWQIAVAAAALPAIVACAVFWPVGTAAAATTVCTVVYVVSMIDRLVIFRRGIAEDAILRISDEQARAIPDAELPPYTIFVPAYREAEVIGRLIGSMRALEYPQDKLQVLLLLEEDDADTIGAAEAAGLDRTVTVLKVPPADPRTKPKACNYGLHYATGEIVTIYDAEDEPDPLQLRRVVAAFRDLPEKTACIQAKLAYGNSRQNVLTAWFTAEYAIWFNFLLPGLMRSAAPIPLGGTSNHIKHAPLVEVGAWDGHNVTEDADLGVRLAVRGYGTAVLDSTTMEEANSDVINWVRQRSRWYKGYLQTWLVHARRPAQLHRSIGTAAFARFTLFLAFTPVLACLNVAFWAIMVLWILGQPEAVAEAFPGYVYYPALVSLFLGNGAAIYMNIVGCRETGNQHLLLPNLIVPLYWVLMSIAAVKGTWQLIVNPSYWEKTFHGLDRPDSGGGPGAKSDAQPDAQPDSPSAAASPSSATSGSSGPMS